MANTDINYVLPNQLRPLTAVFSGNSAWGYGSWNVVDDSIGAGQITGFSFQWNTIPAVDTTIEAIFEISVGNALGNYSAKLQLPFSLRSDTAADYYYTNTIFLPEGYTVSSGSVIAIRVADNQTDSLAYNGIRIIFTASSDTRKPNTPVSNNYMRIGGANPSGAI
jgi:hypothetical protein